MKSRLPEKIGLLIGSFVLFLIFSEILLGLAGFNYYPIDIDVNISEKDRVFRLNRESGYYEIVEEKTVEYTKGVDVWGKLNYQKFKSEKPPNTYRIFVLGGSSVAFLAKPNYTEYSENLFENLYPYNKLEIVFMGKGGSGSYGLLPILKEVLEYEPDLVILYSGHNEFLDDLSMKYYLKNRDLFEEVNKDLEKLRMYQLLAKIIPSMNIQKEIELLEGFSDIDYDNKTQKQRVYESYRLNIDNMIKMAKNKNVDFMVSTVSYNHMSPPMYGGTLEKALSYFNMTFEDFEQIILNSPGEPVEEIEFMISLCDMAINKGEILEGITKAVDEYVKGLKHYKEGQFGKAREHFDKAILLDYAPQRANNITNKIVRELAKEYNIPLADVESAVLEETERGITNYELFGDHCHLNKKGNEILLDTFFITIKENNLVW